MAGAGFSEFTFRSQAVGQPVLPRVVASARSLICIRSLYIVRVRCKPVHRPLQVLGRPPVGKPFSVRKAKSSTAHGDLVPSAGLRRCRKWPLMLSFAQRMLSIPENAPGEWGSLTQRNRHRTEVAHLFIVSRAEQLRV